MIQELKNHRELRRLTQQDMAEILGVAVSTYAKWEQGKMEPKGANKSNIQKLLRGQWEGLHGQT